MITSNIRIPKDVWEKVREISINEERSINAQIIYILKKFIEEYKKD